MTASGKTKLSLLGGAAICFAFLPATLNADITVGVINAPNCNPFMCNNAGTSTGESIEYQQVYASPAFAAPTTITSLTFDYYYTAQGHENVLNGNYDITMSTTSKPVNGLSQNLASNVGPDSATFFNGALGGIYNTSFTVTGTTPFTFDPAGGDLLVDIFVTNQDNVCNQCGSGNGYNSADITGTATSRAYQVPGYGSSADSIGLVTTFGTTETTVTPEPSFLLLVGAGFAGLVIVRRSRAARD